MMKEPTHEKAFQSYLKRGPLVTIAPFTTRPALDPALNVFIEYIPDGLRRRTDAPIDHSGLLHDKGWISK